MNLFGLKFNNFCKIFQKYFIVEYVLVSTTTPCIRIRDKITKSCVINAKLPFVISEEYNDLLRSLYIHIFKHTDSFHLRYEPHEFKLYNRVRKHIEQHLIIALKREKFVTSSLQYVKEACLERAHNNISLYLNNKVNKICKFEEYISNFNDEILYSNKIII